MLGWYVALPPKVAKLHDTGTNRVIVAARFRNRPWDHRRFSDLVSDTLEREPK